MNGKKVLTFVIHFEMIIYFCCSRMNNKENFIIRWTNNNLKICTQIAISVLWSSNNKLSLVIMSDAFSCDNYFPFRYSNAKREENFFNKFGMIKILERTRSLNLLFFHLHAYETIGNLVVLLLIWGSKFFALKKNKKYFPLN